MPEGAVPVPRPPAPGEKWNGKEWQVDLAALADELVSPGHIERAHLIKQIEAALVLSGIALTHGLLAEEAAMTGVTIADLARQVEDRTADFRERETARRMMKQGASHGDA